MLESTEGAFLALPEIKAVRRLLPLIGKPLNTASSNWQNESRENDRLLAEISLGNPVGSALIIKSFPFLRRP